MMNLPPLQALALRAASTGAIADPPTADDIDELGKIVAKTFAKEPERMMRVLRSVKEWKAKAKVEDLKRAVKKAEMDVLEAQTKEGERATEDDVADLLSAMDEKGPDAFSKEVTFLRIYGTINDWWEESKKTRAQKEAEIVRLLERKRYELARLQQEEVEIQRRLRQERLRVQQQLEARRRRAEEEKRRLKAEESMPLRQRTIYREFLNGVKADNIDIVRALLQKNKQLVLANDHMNNERQGDHLLWHTKSIDMFRLLLQNGANPDSHNYGYPRLAVDVYNLDILRVKLLQQFGAGTKSYSYTIANSDYLYWMFAGEWSRGGGYIGDNWKPQKAMAELGTLLLPDMTEEERNRRYTGLIATINREAESRRGVRAPVHVEELWR